ncbi:type VI secretion system protein ImpK [Luteibacter rhizovicinus]|uniref:Type VI secretion system protein ImpK n=1 Tax=Luteibacter rhizovicinus TaxID=242606 RepID=A0A4R3YTQ7_9GAMM|nr:type IVB secretion system protein IcmH/DotU [Luteibacter rhizovicinus]TCV95836.1 type VI secretion system protein ImpK [Luteibacter rhizovicinus]
MSTPGPGTDDPFPDATVVRPRQSAPPVAGPPPPAAPPYASTRSAAPGIAGADISEFLGRSLNPLVQAASPLLLLSVQLRHNASPPDTAHLREQVLVQIRKFESRAGEAGIAAHAVTAARYVLCTMLDEAVLNSPWSEQSGWAQKTLLVTFHSESYGGAKFFLILDRLCDDVPRHVDLIELMYIGLTLGFCGRYQIEAGGRARLAEIQDDLYRRIRAQRGPAAEALAPHWRGIEDRRNPVLRYVPLWVIAAAAACVLFGAFLWFHARLNAQSSPISAQVAQIGLLSSVPPEDAPRPAAARKSLKLLLAPEEQAGLLSVDEQPDGQAKVRLNAAAMFPSGGVDVAPDQQGLLRKVAAAIDQLVGRVVVVGHTDDQPVRSLRFKDNYELSAVRARAVAQILGQGLAQPGRIESSGAGASQPIALPAELPANRTRNRRVEILFQPGA